MSNSQINDVEELVKELNYHADLYYNQNRPEMRDEEYDHLFDKLVELERETGLILPSSPTQRVGYEVKSKLEKVQHTTPLLSLDKTKNVDDLKKFIGNQECLLSLKLDGLTTKLNYDNGKLTQGSTRGSGEIGEDITHNVKTIKIVPKYIPYKSKIEVVSESYINYKDFNEINSNLPEEDKYKNPRNLTAGSVRQLDSNICAKRNVSSYVFGVTNIETEQFTTKDEQFLWLGRQGLNIVPHMIVNKDNIESAIDTLKKYAEDNYIPIDGMVLTYNNIAYSKSLGVTGHHPKDSIAYKFYDETYETTYIQTEYNTTRTGMISITGIFKPVDIDGTTVTRASLHNVDIFESLQLGKGDIVTTYKANMIIPQISDNLTRSNTEQLPTQCPTCGGLVEIRKTKEARFLYCTNDKCEAKLLGKLVHFVSRNALNIDGLSEASIEKFINLGYVKSFTDIMMLEQYKKEIAKLEGFGLKSVNKLLVAIENAKTVPFEKFIYSLGIPNVGSGTAKRLAKHYKDIGDLLNTDYIELCSIEDIGGIVATSIMFYLTNVSNIEEIVKLLSDEFGRIHIQYSSQTQQITNSQLAGKTIVVTGTFTKIKRKDIEKRVEELGAKLSGSVSSKTDMLIAGEKAGSKLAKAQQLGIKIMTDEDEIIKLLQ